MMLKEQLVKSQQAVAQLQRELVQKLSDTVYILDFFVICDLFIFSGC